MNQNEKSNLISPLLIGSAFAGFEGTLLYFLSDTLLEGNVAVGLWGGAMGLLIWAIARRIVQRKGMLIIGAATVVASFVLLSNFPLVVIFSVLLGASLMAEIALLDVLLRFCQKLINTKKAQKKVTDA